MKKLRKALIVSVMFMTVLSMSVVAAPNVNAAASAGDLIKMDGLSSVYYLAADGKRYVFPNESTYFSWYEDFSSVVTIPQSELEGYPLGANVTIRPGTKLVKITTNPKVYAVEPGGSLVGIASEAAAITLYGSGWASRVVDVPDAFFTNYTTSSEELDGTAYPEGSLIKTADSSDVYYVAADGTARKIANEAALSANRFQGDNIITTTLAIPTAGTDIAGAESVLTDTSSGAGGTPVDPIAGTGLTVALASDTPAAATLPTGASGVDFTKINFTAASDGDVTVKNVVITRTGIGVAGDFSGIYLYDADGNRLTSIRTISATSNQATFSGINVSVAAGTTVALVVKAVVSGTSGTNALGVSSASDITTDGAAISGTFPVTGNGMALSSVSAGAATYTLQSVENSTLDVGDNQKEVADIRIQETSSNEDISLQSITFTNDGAADATDVKNFNLYQGSTLVSSLASATGDKVRMVFDTPLTVKKGASKNFSLKADIVGGVSSTAIQMDIDDVTDIVAVGANYGYGVAITAAGSVQTIVVTAGELTIEIDGPAAYDVVADQSDVVLANMTFTTGGNDDVEIKALYGWIDCTDNGTTAVLETGMSNVQLVNVDSMDYYDVTDFDSLATDDDFVFKVTNFTVPAGSSQWRVEMDLSNTYFGNNDVCVFKMDASADNTASTPANSTSAKDGVEAENKDGKALDDIKPGADIQGNNVTIKTATLAVSNETLSNGNAVAKTKDVELLRFSAEAGSAESVKITQVNLQATSTGQYLADAANYTLLASDGTVLQSGVSAVDTTTDTVTFSSLTGGGVTIAAGETEVFYVTTDINSTLTGSMITVSMTSAGVVAEDSDGDTISASDITGDTTSVSGRNITLYTKGLIAFSVDDSSPVKDHILLSGSTGNSIFKFKADASYEDITLMDLRFSVTGTGSSATSSIANVSLYQDGTLIKTVETKTDAYGWVFNNLENIGTNGVTVDKDTDSIFELRLNVAGIGDGAQDTASSGADILFTLLPTTTGVAARGFSSNNDLVAGDITITSVVSQNQYVYASKVTATKPGGQSSTLSSGEEEALRFTLTPSGNENKTSQLTDLVVNFSESGAVNVYGFKLYNGSGTEIASTTAGSVTTSSVSATLAVTDDNISGAGETYILKVFSTSADADDKLNISIDVNGDGGSGDDITWNDGADNTGNITWIDLGESSTVTELKNTLSY